MEIWQTYCNADMAEGRGPMVPDKAFLHREHAERYIDAQPGVMGRMHKWSQDPYGDWRVRRVGVIEFDLVQAEKNLEAIKKQALAKLTPKEKQVLGLE